MYITLFGTILSTSSAKGYERKEALGTIYIKEHEISKENPMVHPIPSAKASENVGCRSRRCTSFFLLILVSLPHLATLWSASSTTRSY